VGLLYARSSRIWALGIQKNISAHYSAVQNQILKTVAVAPETSFTVKRDETRSRGVVVLT
jgi:hypothetical protein